MTSATDLVHEYFPQATAEEALNILWNYTGYPGFWSGDPETACREQLAHLRDVGPGVVDVELGELADATAEPATGRAA